ncbi:MAG: T9SS type A sorting domain-containing protein [Ignavibacteria bacterium]|nr:MAG: T9SS type A sorting domain-containing protein [Ignavibacteria bacterium]
MNSLAMDSYGRLYAGSGEGGVYRSSGGASWFEWNSGLTNLSVYALIVNSKGFLFAGTLGGVFRSVNPVVGAIFSTDRSEIDFPQVPVGKSMVDSFTVYSQGSTPLYIDTATSSDTAFTVFPPRITISPGDSARFYVSFTPQSVRAYTGYIYLANNGASSPDVVTVRGDAVLGIAGENQLPKEFALAQNYPNPFNPLTVIRYTLPRSTFVSLRVYNLLGEAVATLVNELKEPGSYGVAWDGNRRSSGVYFYRIIAGEFVSTRKMIFVR